MPVRSGLSPRTSASTENDSVVGDNIAARAISASSASIHPTSSSQVDLGQVLRMLGLLLRRLLRFLPCGVSLLLLLGLLLRADVRRRHEFPAACPAECPDDHRDCEDDVPRR